jgi:uncharacterized membrane protein
MKILIPNDKSEVIAVLSIYGLFSCNFIFWQYNPNGKFLYIICFTLLIFIIGFLFGFIKNKKEKKKNLLTALFCFGILAFVLFQFKPPNGFNIIGWCALLIFYFVFFASYFYEDD